MEHLLFFWNKCKHTETPEISRKLAMRRYHCFTFRSHKAEVLPDGQEMKVTQHREKSKQWLDALTLFISNESTFLQSITFRLKSLSHWVEAVVASNYRWHCWQASDYGWWLLNLQTAIRKHLDLGFDKAADGSGLIEIGQKIQAPAEFLHLCASENLSFKLKRFISPIDFKYWT